MRIIWIVPVAATLVIVYFAVGAFNAASATLDRAVSQRNAAIVAASGGN